MTTNHRPTLESKRGRANAIKDTIQHSRSLNSQTSLKLRLDIQGTKLDSSTGKRALDELQAERKRPKTEFKEGDELKAAEKAEQHVNAQKKTEVEDDQQSAEDSDEESDSEEEEEEDDDEEALMAELAKLRKEKEKQKLALSGNPLMSPDGTETTSKKSWRSRAPFAKRMTTAPKSFTTNTLESDTHHRFLSKYFR